MTTGEIMAILMMKYDPETVFEGQMGLDGFPAVLHASFLGDNLQTAIDGAGLDPTSTLESESPSRIT